MITKDSKIYFSGINGAGMKPIACALNAIGYKIGGSDSSELIDLEYFKNFQFKINRNQEEGNVLGFDVFVYSSAISETNPEMIAAKKNKITIMHRSEALAFLVSMFKHKIGVIGSHGKTTISSCIFHILNAHLDASCIVGGKMLNYGDNFYLSKNFDIIVIECDESDRSIKNLNLDCFALTQIGNDHIDSYKMKYSNLKKNFIKFLIKNLNKNGKIVLLSNNILLKRIEGSLDIKEKGIKIVKGHVFLNRKLIYPNKLNGLVFNKKSLSYDFQCLIDSSKISFSSNLFQKYNIYNAFLSLIVSNIYTNFTKDINKIEKTQNSINSFLLPDRRMSKRGYLNKALIYDDYAHHWFEIKNSILSMSKIVKYDNRKLIVICEPHRKSRWNILFDHYIKTFIEISDSSKLDTIIITDVYDASEGNEYKFKSLDFIETLKKKKKTSYNLTYIKKDKLMENLKEISNHNSIFLFLGAGEISQIAKNIACERPQ